MSRLRLAPGRIAPAPWVGAILLALPLALCLPASAQTTFYEAWESGLRHEKAGEWAEARAAFLKAKAFHPEPSRRVRSYGLNFVEGYDPDFRLARASLSLQQLDEAEAYLAKARANGVVAEADLATLQAGLSVARAAAASGPAPTAPAAAETPARASASRQGEARPSPVAGGPAAPASQPAGATPPHRPAGVAATPSSRADRAARPEAAASPGDRTPPALDPPILAVPPPSPAALAAEGPAPRTVVTWPLLGGLALLTVASAAAILVFLRRRRLGAPLGASRPDETSPTRITTGRRREGTDPAGWRPSASQDFSLPGGPTGRPDDGEDDPFGASLHPASATVTSRPFGGYVLEELLGRGAMGSTWLARRTRDGLLVAIKIPHDHVLDQDDFVVRFRREGDLGATLHHPNVVQILETGDLNGRPFIVMELVEGETLEALLRREGRLETARALQVVREIALALDYIHMKGIVHRDLKPDNVMVLASGQVKVMDYGIARQADLPSLTASYGYLGTPLYSAPETVTPQEIDPRSDLYSLGIILYRMLTGLLPFSGQHAIQLLHKHASEPLPPFPPELSLGRDLFRLVFELTAKSKEDRFPSAEHFLRELDRVIHLG